MMRSRGQVHQADIAVYKEDKDKAEELIKAGQPQPPAGSMVTEEVTLLEVNREREENLMDT